MRRERAALITPGNLEDDLGTARRLRLDRRGGDRAASTSSTTLYKKLDAVRKKGSIVSSNTSTIPLGKLDRGHAGERSRATS